MKRDVMMTQNIIRHDGVIVDFQGDSALGFWGWPLGLDGGGLCRPAGSAADDGGFELHASELQVENGHTRQQSRMAIGKIDGTYLKRT